MRKLARTDLPQLAYRLGVLAVAAAAAMLPVAAALAQRYNP